MKKHLNSIDIVDLLWDYLYERAKAGEVLEDGESFSEFCEKGIGQIEAESRTKNLGFSRFLFEATTLRKRPNRSSLTWGYGEHVSLYDVYVCKKHSLTIKTSDSYESILPEHVTLFCPECNKELFLSKEKYESYSGLLRARIHEKDAWKFVCRTISIHRKINREENIKYWLGKLKDPKFLYYYFYHRLKRALTN